MERNRHQHALSLWAAVLGLKNKTAQANTNCNIPLIPSQLLIAALMPIPVQFILSECLIWPKPANSICLAACNNPCKFDPIFFGGARDVLSEGKKPLTGHRHRQAPCTECHPSVHDFRPSPPPSEMTAPQPHLSFFYLLHMFSPSRHHTKSGAFFASCQLETLPFIVTNKKQHITQRAWDFLHFTLWI